ncbi:hypothetical protein EV361DRAFT_988621, partial [Lentinula raphanica]
MSRPHPNVSTITTTTAIGREEELRIFLQPTWETPAERRRREAEEEEAALQELQRRREENQRRRDEEEAEEKRKEEEETARRVEEEKAQREAEEAAEAERRRKVKEGKKRKAEEEKAGKAKKTKVTDSGQGPSSEQLRAARLRRFSRTSNASTRASPMETNQEAGPSRIRQNVGTGGDPSDDEYPGGDNGEDDSSNDEPNPSGDESPEERGACERCIRLERVEQLNNLEVDIQALKEGFVDIVQGQHEILELVRDSASSTDGRLQAIERRFSNLEGTLVHLMKKALG